MLFLRSERALLGVRKAVWLWASRCPLGGLSFLSYKTNSLKWSLRVLNLAFWDYCLHCPVSGEVILLEGSIQMGLGKVCPPTPHFPGPYFFHVLT